MDVIDSRPTLFIGEQSIRRRRKCRKCGKRDSTFEISAVGRLASQLDRAKAIIRLEARFKVAYEDLIKVLSHE